MPTITNVTRRSPERLWSILVRVLGRGSRPGVCMKCWTRYAVPADFTHPICGECGDQVRILGTR
jgi:hypothetical protein